MAVMQAVLLFGSETWVLNPRMEKFLEGFHYREARWMSGMGPKPQLDGTWAYPPIGAVLEMVGMEEIRVYIARHQNTVAQYIDTLTIMKLCLEAESKPGIRLSRKWWEQPDMDIMGIRVGKASVKGGR